MVALSNIDLHSLFGTYTRQKSCSDDLNKVLALHGVNMLACKAATAASVHLTIPQPSSNEIKMAQPITAGKFSGTNEDYTLDWEWGSNEDSFFGTVEGRSRWVGVDEGRK
ncbi:hypothetical protein BU25DRAFT_414085 [Macroventuria anomochaeta]|uniref:Uncharacterized protein n=1 Tax=Macroventuria anomochaeta TaxID=301207 RepID=A0ACB6RR57_9PLEO|nr:uncharacterized protein BU25DRAFT_414085 [Macroventuria anomochaeta]KAF2623618.1 hypothetical protein BU25DRAFT_414085 [Macroventuria anomochaeta]